MTKMRTTTLFLGGIWIFIRLNVQMPLYSFVEHSETVEPRMACLRSGKVNLHVGPGLNYPVDWVLTRKHMPVQILSEFGAWRRIKLFDETVGWVHKSLLCAKKTAILPRAAILVSAASRNAKHVAKIGKHVVVQVVKRTAGFVKVLVTTPEQDKIVGWLPGEYLWGLS